MLEKIKKNKNLIIGAAAILAVGATSKNIRNQFLTEAVFLTAIGGATGIFLGSLLSFVISTVLSRALDLNWVFTFPVGAAILGLSISALVGIVFGLYPAFRRPRKARLRPCGTSK